MNRASTSDRDCDAGEISGAGSRSKIIQGVSVGGERLSAILKQPSLSRSSV
jgi:hypothetical protein